mmetsp:Transcript_23502/g.65091  ORF Transcript_23502/g.65091 Transcript_23502/m.65091 type:complete len:322 (+) Transcript_23502:779-1744(+)
MQGVWNRCAHRARHHVPQQLWRLSADDEPLQDALAPGPPGARRGGEHLRRRLQGLWHRVRHGDVQGLARRRRGGFAFLHAEPGAGRRGHAEGSQAHHRGASGGLRGRRQGRQVHGLGSGHHHRNLTACRQAAAREQAAERGRPGDGEARPGGEGQADAVHRADRLRELYLAGRHGVPWLGADQQVLGGPAGQPLLRRQRDHRQSREPVQGTGPGGLRPGREAVGRQRAAVLREPRQLRGVHRAAAASLADDGPRPAQRRPPHARLLHGQEEDLGLVDLLRDAALQGGLRDWAHRLRRAAQERARLPACHAPVRSFGLPARH